MLSTAKKCLPEKSKSQKTHINTENLSDITHVLSTPFPSVSFDSDSVSDTDTDFYFDDGSISIDESSPCSSSVHVQFVPTAPMIPILHSRKSFGNDSNRNSHLDTETDTDTDTDNDEREDEGDEEDLIDSMSPKQNLKIYNCRCPRCIVCGPFVREYAAAMDEDLLDSDDSDGMNQMSYDNVDTFHYCHYDGCNPHHMQVPYNDYRREENPYEQSQDDASTSTTTDRVVGGVSKVYNHDRNDDRLALSSREGGGGLWSSPIDRR